MFKLKISKQLFRLQISKRNLVYIENIETNPFVCRLRKEIMFNLKNIKTTSFGCSLLNEIMLIKLKISKQLFSFADS